MDLSSLEGLEPHVLRHLIPGWLANFIADPARAASNLERMAAVTCHWTDETCRSVLGFLADLGGDHRVYRAHPACREVSRAWCQDVVLEPVVRDLHHVEAAAEGGPTLLIGNHLSYFDANALDAALAWERKDGLADRVVAAAGPKVYQDVFRRFAASCINTLPVPQSRSLHHTEKLSARELARKAMAGLKAAAQALSDGNVVLIYPEGSRSRSGRLQPFLRGVHRWLSAVDGLRVVPVALTGTSDIMPISATKLTPGRITLSFGAPLQVGKDGTARDVLASAHHALRALLPTDLRPPSDMPATG